MKNTKQKTKVETRKHKALRRTLIFLGVLVVFSVLHLYTFTPMQGVRQTEAQLGIGRTHLIRRISGVKWNEMVYMTANENAILITEVGFNPLLGWSGLSIAVFDCSDEEDFQAGPIFRQDGDDKVAHWAICGRLRSPEVVGIRAECRNGYWDEETEMFRTLTTTTISGGPEIWTEKDGWRYFFAETTIPDAENGESVYPTEMTVTTLDEAGNPLRQYEQSDDLYERFIPADQ